MRAEKKFISKEYVTRLNGSPFFGNLAMNLASWSPDGTDIDQISCDLSDYLDFRPPPVSAQPQPRIAYCYFPRDPATS